MFGDVFVVRRERVSLEAKWADPYPCSGINSAVKVRSGQVRSKGGVRDEE